MIDKKKRGRPVTGTAMTATERANKRDKELLDKGGHVLSTVRLNPEAVSALQALTTNSTEVRVIIETALIELAIQRGLIQRSHSEDSVNV